MSRGVKGSLCAAVSSISGEWSRAQILDHLADNQVVRVVCIQCAVVNWIVLLCTTIVHQLVFRLGHKNVKSVAGRFRS